MPKIAALNDKNLTVQNNNCKWDKAKNMFPDAKIFKRKFLGIIKMNSQKIWYCMIFTHSWKYISFD